MNSTIFFCFISALLAVSSCFVVTKVLIVGAGPVGLWTAIQLKLNRPNVKVIMFEKRLHYVRTSVFRIDKGPLQAGFGGTEYFNQFWEPQLAQVGRWITSPPTVKTKDPSSQVDGVSNRMVLQVSCSEFETKLRSIAESLGINFQHFDLNLNTVESFYQQITALEVDIVIGADGRHSKVRDLLMAPQPLPIQPNSQAIEEQIDLTNVYQHTAVLKFQISDNNGDLTRKDALMWLNWRILNRLRFHSAAINFGRLNKDGKMAVTVTMPIQENIFRQLKKICSDSQQAKCTQSKLDSHGKVVLNNRIPRVLSHDIRIIFTYLAGNEEELNHLLLHNQLALVQVDAFRSKNSSVTKINNRKQEVTYFLVGDALMGVPYFKGLSTGISSSNNLARILIEAIPEPSSLSSLEPESAVSLEELKSQYMAVTSALFKTNNSYAKSAAAKFGFLNSFVRSWKKTHAWFFDTLQIITGDKLWHKLQRPFMRF